MLGLQLEKKAELRMGEKEGENALLLRVLGDVMLAIANEEEEEEDEP